MAAALPHLMSLNAYYRFNVAYHAISKLWTKSDKAAAVKTLKGHQYVSKKNGHIRGSRMLHGQRIC